MRYITSGAGGSSNASRARRAGRRLLSPDWLVEQVERGCPLTGLPFDLSRGHGSGRTALLAPSVNRIDSDKPYDHPDNVEVIVQPLNRLFGPWGEEAVIPVVVAWLRRRGFAVTYPCTNGETT